MIQKISVIVLATLLGSKPVYASFACFKEPTKSSSDVAYFMQSEPNQIELQALQCSTKTQLDVGLKAFSFSLQAGSLYAACTGVGAPAALWLQGGSLGATLVGMVVGELPCEDSTTEEKIKAMAKEVVCETLIQNGIECHPSNL